MDTRTKTLGVLLRCYRDGADIKFACEAEGLTRSAFYRLKDDHPDDYAAIEIEAKRQAEVERRALVTAGEVRQELITVELRDSAAEILLSGMGNLKRIVAKDGYLVKETGGGKPHWITIYPRDQIAAMKMLQELAQLGTRPEKQAVLPQSEERPALPPLGGGPTHFTNVSLPVGTEVSIKTPEAVDAEVTVLD